MSARNYFENISKSTAFWSKFVVELKGNFKSGLVVLESVFRIIRCFVPTAMKLAIKLHSSVRITFTI